MRTDNYILNIADEEDTSEFWELLEEGKIELDYDEEKDPNGSDWEYKVGLAMHKWLCERSPRMYVSFEIHGEDNEWLLHRCMHLQQWEREEEEGYLSSADHAQHDKFTILCALRHYLKHLEKRHAKRLAKREAKKGTAE